MIIVTGAAGFIASCLVEKLIAEGLKKEIIIVDDFRSRADKQPNFVGKNIAQQIERQHFIAWLKENYTQVDFIFHLGARTDTTEQNIAVFDELNLNYSKQIFSLCSQHAIPMVYASSAATYGAGEYGYDDNELIIKQLKPLNPYGDSKNNFDKWVLEQEKTPPFWAGLKFFNVYGRNEYHKGRMASVIFHAAKQIEATSSMKLFRSHRAEVKDGEQMRDFIYVNDVTSVCYFLLKNQTHSGIFNLGSGKARTFLDLVTLTFEGLRKKPNIGFVDTPADIRDTYQYFTEANMKKLRSVGYSEPFYTLEEGIADYMKYLKKYLAL